MHACMQVYTYTCFYTCRNVPRSAEEDTAPAERSLEDCLHSFSKQELSCAGLGPLSFPKGRHPGPTRPRHSDRGISRTLKHPVISPHTLPRQERKSFAKTTGFGATRRSSANGP